MKQSNIHMQSPSSRRLALVVMGALFFIFGMVSWVNSILIPYFKVCCELSHAQSYLVAMSFYIAYLLMSVPNSKVLDRIGIRRGITVGLWTMSLGSAVFVPAALLRSYPLFLAGLFIIGTGLSMLQTVANPTVTALGPINSAARRISIMGLCNKTAGILAPLIFAAVILRPTDAETFHVIESNLVVGTERVLLLNSIIRRVILPYSVLAAFLFLFGLAVRFIPMPQVDSCDGDDAMAERPKAGSRSIWNYPYFVLGVIALFLHVAEQVVSVDTVISYAVSMGYSLQEAKVFPSLTLLCSLIGYCAGIVLIPRFVSQLHMLRVSVTAGLVLSLLVLVIPGTAMISGHPTSLSIFCLNALGFCNALIYAGIWPLAIHDLGSHTNRGSSFMVMALCGNAFLPVVYGLFADRMGLREAYWVLLPCFLYLIFYAFKGYKIKTWK